jgi:hypothetical protein
MLENLMSILTYIYSIEVRGHCMCREMPVIPAKRRWLSRKNIGKKWRATEEERHKG